MQWFLYFLYYAQAVQPVPSTKVQASSVTANTILMIYQFTGGLQTDPWDMPLECGNKITIDMLLMGMWHIYDTYS